MDGPIKVAAITEWPKLSEKKGVQSFVGFFNFYRWFIQDFLHHTHPLFNLTKKDTKWQWTSTEQAAFDRLNELVTTAPVVMLPSNTAPYRLEADSSDFTTSAALLQLSEMDGKWHPVTFMSKSLNLVERNYEIHDKEMLAIIRALDEWQHFLEGARHKFKIWTDHKNLQYFMTS